jgi:hypothetical protein
MGEKMIKDVIILCLDKRRELWEDLTSQCLKKGWTVHQFIVGDGTDPRLRYKHIDKSTITPGWQWGTGIGAIRHCNAFHSHRSIIKYAVKKELSNILLLEDDSYILDRYDYIMDKLEDNILSTTIDLLYMGWHAFEFDGDYAVGKNSIIEKEWAENQKCELLPINFNVGGFHAVWINNSAYIPLLNFPATVPMDCHCNYSHLDRYMISPKVFHVKNTFSYCENKEVTREIL